MEFSACGSGIRRKDWSNQISQEMTDKKENINTSNIGANQRKEEYSDNTGAKRKRSEHLASQAVEPKRVLLSLKLQVQQQRSIVPTRQPKGPDSTKGFSKEYQKSRTVLRT